MTILFAIALYAFSMSITPGPANLVVLSTSVNHGFLKTVPFVSGATFGASVIMIIVGMGLGKILSEDSLFFTVFSYLGAAFIVYLLIKILLSSCDINLGQQKQLAPGFLKGIILAWLNPKSWIAILAGISAFGVAGNYQELPTYIITYISVAYLCMLVWAFAGSKIARFLKNCRNLRIFNLTMGAALILIAGYIISF